MLLFLAFASAVVPSGTSFDCTPTKVWDGDGPIWCAEGPRIRLEGIAAREIDGTCRRNHPCPAASGRAARDHLVALLGGEKGRGRAGHVLVNAPTMRCRSGGSAMRERTEAMCNLPGVGDLSCAMVRSGTALRWKAYHGDRVCR